MRSNDPRRAVFARAAHDPGGCAPPGLEAAAAELLRAILLVAGGAVTAVSLTGLPYGERLLPFAQEAAQERSLRITVEVHPDGARSLVVRRAAS